MARGSRKAWPIADMSSQETKVHCSCALIVCSSPNSIDRGEKFWNPLIVEVVRHPLEFQSSVVLDRDDLLFRLMFEPLSILYRALTHFCRGLQETRADEVWRFFHGGKEILMTIPAGCIDMTLPVGAQKAKIFQLSQRLCKSCTELSSRTIFSLRALTVGMQELVIFQHGRYLLYRHGMAKPTIPHLSIFRLSLLFQRSLVNWNGRHGLLVRLRIGFNLALVIMLIFNK